VPGSTPQARTAPARGSRAAQRRRASGEGTIYQRRDGRWEAAVWVTTPAGEQRRKRVYARTREACHAKYVSLLDKALRHVPMVTSSPRLPTSLVIGWSTLLPHLCGPRPTRNTSHSSVWISSQDLAGTSGSADAAGCSGVPRSSSGSRGLEGAAARHACDLTECPGACGSGGFGLAERCTSGPGPSS
jgi:hypothetical protein